MNQERFDELAKASATNDLSQLRFGRSRFLRLMGLGLLGSLAATFGAPRQAETQQTEEEAETQQTEEEAEAQQTATTTSPCYYYPECSPGCSGAESGYTPYEGTCPSEEGYAGNCWFGESPRSDGGTDIWMCCDYLVDDTNDPCLCSTYTTTHW